MAQGKNASEVMLKADEVTLVVKAEKDGKIRLRANDATKRRQRR